MANILFLVHRLPYPPNKGDKVRSFHLLKHLAAKHRVFLGTFVDDPDDQQYVDTVKGYCADSHFASLNPRSARIRSLNGLLAGEPLTLRYYRDAGLQDWVNRICQTREIDSIVIFCSATAPGTAMVRGVGFRPLRSPPARRKAAYSRSSAGCRASREPDCG